MVLVRFPDAAAKRAALGWLPGRFSLKSRPTGEMRLPADALACLTAECIPFTVIDSEDA